MCRSEPHVLITLPDDTTRNARCTWQMLRATARSCMLDVGRHVWNTQCGMHDLQDNTVDVARSAFWRPTLPQIDAWAPEGHTTPTYHREAHQKAERATSTTLSCKSCIPHCLFHTCLATRSMQLRVVSHNLWRASHHFVSVNTRHANSTNLIMVFAVNPCLRPAHTKTGWEVRAIFS